MGYIIKGKTSQSIWSNLTVINLWHLSILHTNLAKKYVLNNAVALLIVNSLVCRTLLIGEESNSAY